MISETKLAVSNEFMHKLINAQYIQWLEAKASFMLELEVQTEIAAQLKLDKAEIIAAVESRIKECVLALQVLDKKLQDIV